MNINVFNTHIELFPYINGDFPIIEKQYTAQDKFTGNEFPCGYLVDNGVLYLPRGSSISQLESLTGVKANYINESDSILNISHYHESLTDPRDELQEQSIEFLKSNDHQLSLNLKTGFGKSFCVAKAIADLNIKALIITPNDSLKHQWMVNTFRQMIGFRMDELYDISGSSVIDAIMNDLIPPANIYFVNHQTLHSYLMQNNGFLLHKFFQKLQIGIKVYDESHMNFGNILLIDFFSNTDRTWYLTATFDRSDKSESACFKRAFQSVIPFGEYESKAAVKKHVVYHVCNIYSKITAPQKARLMGYPGFSSVKYGKYAFFEDTSNSAYNTILSILNKTKNIEGKTLIFVPIIDAVDEIVKRLKRDFPEKSVAAYHSKISSDEKESAEKKDIIVSTIKSCGTGKDIKGLRSIICAEPVASKVVTEQMIGRLRPYAEDKDTYYWDIVDRAIPALNWWYKSRMKKIPDLTKQIIQLNM